MFKRKLLSTASILLSPLVGIIPIFSQEVRQIPKAIGFSVSISENVRSETKPDYELERAISQLREYQIHTPKKVQYAYSKVDLNGDKRLDALVRLNATYGSGSGGFHVWLFHKNPQGYKLAGEILHVQSVIVSTQKVNGWSLLVGVPGNFRRDPIYYFEVTHSGGQYGTRQPSMTMRKIQGKAVFTEERPYFIKMS